MAEVTRIDWLDALPTAVLLARDERVVFANAAAGDLIGSPQLELAGSRIEDFLSEMGEATCLKTRAGGVIFVNLTSTEVEYEGRPAQLLTVLKREPNHIFRDVVEAGIDSFFLVQIERGDDGQLNDLLVLDANERAINNVGLVRDQLIGHRVREVLTEKSANRLFGELRQMLEVGKPSHGELQLSDMLVEDGWYEIQLIPLEGNRVAGFLRDITERKESEEVLQSLALEVEQQARLLDEVLRATPDAFILFDRAGRYLYVNRKGLENSGMTVDQVAGKTWRELGFPEETGIRFEQRLQHVFSTGESITYEEQFPTLLGLRDFVTTLTPIHDNDGNVIFMLNTIHDITERKEAEREQQKLTADMEQQARIFDEVLSTTPDSFLMIDRDGKFLYASPSALRNANLPPAQVVGKTWSELGFPEEAGKSAEKLMAQVLESGEPSAIENAFPTVNGLRSFESIYTPLHDKEGKIVAIVITNRDITERMRIEEALRENQRLLTSIYDTALVGIAVIDEQGHYVQVNQTLCEIYGYSAAELIGKHFTIMYLSDSRDRGVETHARLIRGEGDRERSDWTIRRKNGQLIEVSTFNNLLVRENGERFRIVVVMDVTAQKQAQTALEESEQRLTSILSSMQDAVWSVRADTRQLIYANPVIEALTGYSAHEFTADQNLLTEIVHAEDRGRFTVQLDDARAGARVDTEYRIVRRDGVTRWIRNRFWLVEGGEARRIDGIMTDVTDHRRAAEQTMQLAFERERVRILSNFVRDASHEFRTPLSVINTRLYLLEKVDDPVRQGEYIEGIREQSERILKLVESLITMSQLDSISEFRFEQVDLNQELTVIQVSAELAARRRGLTFTLELPPEKLFVRGEMRWLTIAFNAILDNAMNFTPSGGQITLSGSRLNDAEIAVDVRDTGVGINRAELPRIFERFYRVDRARSMQGFGLGLPIARKIVEMHGGRIEIETVPQEGSLFRLIFPADKSSA